jgi:integrase
MDALRLEPGRCAVSFAMTRPRRFLRDSRVTPDTLQRYKQAVQGFLRWSEEQHEEPETVEELDNLLAEYIEDLFAEGTGYDQGKNVFFRILFFRPRWRGQLPEAHSALKGWERKRVVNSHPPMSWNVALLLAATFAKQGRFAQGVATLCMHDCLLRVSELCNLTPSDIGLPAHLRLGNSQQRVVIALRRTKTGRHQSVEVERPEVEELLRVLVRERLGHERLFPFSAAVFRKQLKEVLAQHGLSRLNFSPHSLRHGGATEAFVSGKSVESILARGRWRSVEAARIYIQSGRALLLQLNIPILTLQVATTLSAFPTSALLIARASAQLH